MGNSQDGARLVVLNLDCENVDYTRDEFEKDAKDVNRDYPYYDKELRDRTWKQAQDLRTRGKLVDYLDSIKKVPATPSRWGYIKRKVKNFLGRLF